MSNFHVLIVVQPIHRMNHYFCIGMPRRQRFQHRKKQDREWRAKRLSAKSPSTSEYSHESDSDLTSTVSSSVEQQSPMTEQQSPPVTSTAQMSNTEHTPEAVSSPLRQIHSTISLPSSFWSDQSPENLETIMLCRNSYVLNWMGNCIRKQSVHLNVRS